MHGVFERLNKVTQRLSDEPGFNVLSDVLETLRFRGSIFFRSELAAPWGMSLPQEGIPRFHIALSGQCFVGSESGNSVEVHEHEIVMLPAGGSHWIADQPGRRLIPSARAGQACELGAPLFQQGEITNRLMCGLVQFDQEAAHPIFDSLPDILHFPMLDQDEPIWSTVRVIDAEIRRNQGAGSGSGIIDRLTEVLFLQLLDRYVDENRDAPGFLAALRDRRVNHALTLIHQAPEIDWSLAVLGERVGMSRATLVRHFQGAIGMAPMAYVVKWRLMKAYNLIKYSAMSVEQIAQSVGFASPRTLNKAFQRQYGRTLSEMRQEESAA